MSTLSTSDNTQWDKLDSFTDREQVLNLFKQALQSSSPGQLHLISVKGNSGTGKSFLIEYLSRRVCPSFGWQTGQLAFAQSTPDFRTILLGLEDALKGCVPAESLNHYRVKRDEYNRRFDEYKAAITIGSIQQIQQAQNHSLISSSPQSIQINAQLHERELQLRSELSRALIELAEESEQPLCLFIDGYERLVGSAPELVGWLWEESLLGLARATPQPLVAMTCGWEWPSNAALEPFIRIELADFNIEQMKSYLEKQGVISASSDSSLSGNQRLIDAFYDLTKGHPLVLGLAVTYFKGLDSNERTAENLLISTELIDEQARVQFLDERLLKRLPEPDRTLLERGPILRTFNQQTLQALLNLIAEDSGVTVGNVDDRTYDHFLQYPFINQGSSLSSDFLKNQPSFHSLVRRVRLEALRRYHPQTKEKLHRTMVDFYRRMAYANQQLEKPIEGLDPRRKQVKVSSRKSITSFILTLLERVRSHPQNGTVKDTTEASPVDKSRQLMNLPDEEFRAVVEHFYHALQVKTLQVAAFNEWRALTVEAVDRWHHRQASLLLELIRQLAGEDEPYLNRIGNPYGQYLLCYSNSLLQQARWQEVRRVLEQAIEIFNRQNNLVDLATCLVLTAGIYSNSGEWKRAINYLEQAHMICERRFDQVRTPEERGNIALQIAAYLLAISSIYRIQKELEQAAQYLEQARSLLGQTSNYIPDDQLLYLMGATYLAQEEWEQALGYFQQVRTIRERKQNAEGVAESLAVIGAVYGQQKKWDQALNSFERALSFNKQKGNSPGIFTCLQGIAFIYQQQEKWEQALDYYERSLPYCEGNSLSIAACFQAMAFIYQQQRNLEQALDYYTRTLSFYEQMDNATLLTSLLLNIGDIYQRQEKWEQAIEQYERARHLYEQLGHDFENDLANLLWHLADCYRQLGNREESETHEARAKQIREELQKSS